MKRKSYLRGFGLGLVVAALVMGAASPQTMTDEQIMARAKELGMIEGNAYLVEKETAESASETESMAETESEETTESIAETESEETAESVVELESEESPESIAETESEETAESVVEAEAEESPESIAETESEETTESVVETESEESPESISESESEETTESVSETESATTPEETQESIVFEVYSGDSSESVSRRLAQAGLVTDAGNYDRYLCQNGYDKKIRVGRYELTAGMSKEEIANTLTRK